MNDTLTFEPSTGPMGAVVHGLDSLSDSHAVREMLLDGLRKHLVLVVRGHKRPSNSELVSFASLFGELMLWFKPEERLPDAPEITLISNVEEDGRPIGNGGNVELGWHTNYSYQPRVALHTVLEAVEVPVGQGNTYFADMYRAYDDLPPRLAERIEGLSIHHAIRSYGGRYVSNTGDISQLTSDLGDDDPANPQAIHSIVRSHPHTGRRTLFDVGMLGALRIVGLSTPESAELLQELYEHATQQKYVYAHQWQAGDVVIWDNLGTMHFRDPFDAAERRVMRRLDVAEPEVSGLDPRSASPIPNA